MDEQVRNLATKLLSSGYDDLPERERRVLGRIAARAAISRNINDSFHRDLSFGDRLADRIAALKPRDGADFGTTEQWRHYNSLYFPYVVGVRAYAQNATAAGLIAADLRGRVPADRL